MNARPLQRSGIARFLRDPSQAWTRVFILVTLFLFALFLLLWALLTPPTPQEGWLQELERQLAAEPREGSALRPLTDALRRVDWAGLEHAREGLEEVASLTRMPGDDIGRLVFRHRDVVQLMGLAAAASPPRLPTLTTAVEPISRPGMREMENLSLLLTSHAVLRVLEGRPVEGIERLLETMMVGAMLCRPEEEASLSLHLAGFTLMEHPAHVLREIMHHRNLDQEDLAAIAQSLARIEEIRQPIAGAVLSEYRLVGNSISEAPDRPAALANILQFYNPDLGREAALAEAFTRFQDAITVPGDLPRFLDALRLALEENTPPAHPQLDADRVREIAGNPMLHVNMVDATPLLLREADLLARLRLLRALALYRMGREEGIKALIDPFTGAPFLIGKEQIQSAGRDGTGPSVELYSRRFQRRMTGTYSADDDGAP